MNINIKQELVLPLPYNKEVRIIGKDTSDKTRMGDFKVVVGFKGDQHDKASLGSVEMSRTELYELRDGINALLGVK